jgi:acyl-CoA synthetase (AMP-forming)/AMP-acid ligase II
MLVSEIAARNAEFYCDAIAVIDPGSGRSSTWAELDERASRLARVLRSEFKLEKGDRLTMFAPNCAEYLEFYFACARSGVIGNAINIRLSPGELASYLRVVEPAAALVHASLSGAADAWLPEVPSIQGRVIGFGGAHDRAFDLETLLDAAEPTDPGYAVSEDDAYQLAATSGTTGTPKAAVMTHRNAVAAILNWAAELPVAERGCYIQCIPMFFNPGGPAGIHPVMLKGGRSVIYPGFDPAVFLRAITEHQVAHATLVPTMVRMILDQLECATTDFSSLRSIVIGGAPLPRALLEEGRATFGDVFFPFYGMAESYSSGMVLRREEQFSHGTEQQLRHLWSAGKPMVQIQVRIVGEDGRDVARDNETPGEIWMRGANVCREYFRMPEETAAVRQGEWLKTGDIAVIDDEGFVTIVDRSKDIIITGGINVYSRDIEEALHAHPEVAAAAAIGVPHERWGEAIHGVVVLAPDATVTEPQLIEFAAARLARFKKPRSVSFVDELPVSATGKVLKRELRARYATLHQPR